MNCTRRSRQPSEGGNALRLLEHRKDFIFDAAWNGRRLSPRQVGQIFAEEPNQIVVVTVYVYYFKGCTA